jgi:hypothetical protein
MDRLNYNNNDNEENHINLNKDKINFNNDKNIKDNQNN